MVSLESLLTELKENRYFNKVHLGNLTICSNEAPWAQYERTTSLHCPKKVQRAFADNWTEIQRGQDSIGGVGNTDRRYSLMYQTLGSKEHCTAGPLLHKANTFETKRCS